MRPGHPVHRQTRATRVRVPWVRFLSRSHQFNIEFNVVPHATASRLPTSLSRSLGRFFSSCHVRVKSCLDVGDDCSLILVNSYLVATHTSHLDTPPCDRQRHLSRHRRRASVSASVCVRARSSSFVVGSFVVGSFVRSFVGVFWDFWISLRVIFEEFADVPSFVPSFAHSLSPLQPTAHLTMYAYL